MYKIFLFTLLTLFFADIYAAQWTNYDKAIIDVKPIKNENNKPNGQIHNDTLFRFEDDSYVFPVIFSHNRPDVADKINLLLQITHLSQVPGKYLNNNPFYVSDNDLKCGQTTFIAYSVSFASDNILKIEIESEQTYCTGIGSAIQTSTDHFDLYTGNKILFEDLFNNDGMMLIKKEVINSFKKQFDNTIVKIKKESQQITSDSEKELLNEQIALYTDCKDYTSLEYFNDNPYVLVKNGIQITRKSCWANESERGIDEYGTPSFFLKYMIIFPDYLNMENLFWVTQKHLFQTPL